MTDYQKMYDTLFHEISRAIEVMQEAQKKTEEMYISSTEVPLILELDQKEKSKK